MVKNDFVKVVSEKLPEDVKLSQKTLNDILDVVFEALSDSVVFEALSDSIVSEGRFAYPGFGTFTVKTRAARKGINPRTKRSIDIPESKTIGFKLSPKLKGKLQ